MLLLFPVCSGAWASDGTTHAMLTATRRRGEKRADLTARASITVTPRKRYAMKNTGLDRRSFVQLLSGAAAGAILAATLPPAKQRAPSSRLKANCPPHRYGD